MKTFARHFPVTKIRNFVDYYQSDDRKKKNPITAAAMKFFKAKLKAGELKSVPNATGHRLNFVHQWNGLVAGILEKHEQEWALEGLADMFDHIFLITFLTKWQPKADDPMQAAIENLYGDNGREEAAMVSIHAEIVKLMDTGDFSFAMTSKHENCFRTGEYFNIQFEEWTPVIGKVQRADGQKSVFVPAEPVAEPTGARTAQLEFKTGDLVAMDWFRDEDNTLDKWLKARGSDKIGSVNYDKGIFDTVEFHAKLGIVHVMVGNSSPSVYTGEGTIAVGSNWREYTADGRGRYSDCDDDGNESEEAEAEYELASTTAPTGMVAHGSVCTDLWWVTIMERSLLAEILGEDYAKEEFNVEIQVEPGKYTLHYDAHPSSFYKLLDDKTKFGIGTPYFALTKDTT